MCGETEYTFILHFVQQQRAGLSKKTTKLWHPHNRHLYHARCLSWGERLRQFSENSWNLRLDVNVSFEERKKNRNNHCKGLCSIRRRAALFCWGMQRIINKLDKQIPLALLIKLYQSGFFFFPRTFGSTWPPDEVMNVEELRSVKTEIESKYTLHFASCWAKFHTVSQQV